MNRKEAAELLPFIRAFAEGKIIEFKDKRFKDKWDEMSEFPNSSFKSFEYRIKPESKYRSFANAEECLQEMQKHQPFGWIKCKKVCFNIVYVNDFYAGLSDKDGSAILLASKNSYQDNTFFDGTPFGMKEEE